MSTRATLATCLARIQTHAHHLQSLDIQGGADTAEAIAESRRLQGTVLMFQRLLQHLDEDPELTLPPALLRRAA